MARAAVSTLEPSSGSVTTSTFPDLRYDDAVVEVCGARATLFASIFPGGTRRSIDTLLDCTMERVGGRIVYRGISKGLRAEMGVLGDQTETFTVTPFDCVDCHG